MRVKKRGVLAREKLTPRSFLFVCVCVCVCVCVPARVCERLLLTVLLAQRCG
jgi:hypothetical protein